jgi:outer membrane protein assembly factor BamA
MERHRYGRRVLILPLLAVFALPPAAAAAQPPSPPGGDTQGPPLRAFTVEGASVYSRDDVLWLLHLREGAALPVAPAQVARSLKERYERDGYTKAEVTADYQNGMLTLRVDEGRIDQVEITGLSEKAVARIRDDLEIKPGDVYNKRSVGQAVDRIVERSGGALAARGDIVLERRTGGNVLTIPLGWNRVHTAFTSGTETREDFYSPVDALAPAIGFTTTIFDHRDFNHTFIDASVSYKFGRDSAGYSLGIERPLFKGPRLFLGAEIHDLSATDDLWRVSPLEQSLVALGFKNTFRDYYRRRGQQIFSVFQMGASNALSAMLRWDRHEPLANGTDFSFFRDDHEFRPNPPVQDQRVHAMLFGYTLDTRGMSGAGQVATYEAHLADNLFGFGRRQQPGVRIDWTSEIAGHGLGGDAEFDRHIFDTRGYLSFSPRQLWSARSVLGFSGGTLPIERRFAIGGIGTVHGYGFKEAAGDGMALFNTEYRVDVTSPRHGGTPLLAVHAFYDLGKITGPFNGSRTDWLHGIGVGISLASIRVEFGFRADDIPHSRQILVRLGPTF